MTDIRERLSQCAIERGDRMIDGWRLQLASEEDLAPELRHALMPDGAAVADVTGFVAVGEQGELLLKVELEVRFEEFPHEQGTVAIEVDTAHRTARLNKLFVPSLLVGQGHGKRLMMRTVRLLEDLGVRYLGVTAIAVGKYLWANCGFDFDNRHYAETVNSACAKFAVELGLVRSEDEWRFLKHPWQFAVLDVDENGSPRVLPHEHVEAVIERLGWPLARPLPEGTEVQPSKLLLIHSRYSEWHGTLDLEDDLQREVLSLYAGPYDVDGGSPLEQHHRVEQGSGTA